MMIKKYAFLRKFVPTTTNNYNYDDKRDIRTV